MCAHTLQMSISWPPGVIFLQDLSQASRALARGEKPTTMPALPCLSAFLGETPEAIALPRPGRSSEKAGRKRISKSMDSPLGRRGTSTASSKDVMGIVIDRLESFHAATPRSFVKQRRAELELVQPFMEARDLMHASLTDKGDRDRKQLAALVGESGGSISRARAASEEIVKSNVKLPTNVLLEFLAACDACEQVLSDRVTGGALRGKWLQGMRGAAEHYLARMRASQKQELEESWLQANAFSESEHAHPQQNICPPMFESGMDNHFEAQFGLLSEFLGESPPSLSDIFSRERQAGMMGRLMQCMPKQG